MNRYKHGDPAMVKCSDGQWRLALYDEWGDKWRFADNKVRHAEDSEARPVLVTDAEDEESLSALLRVAGFGSSNNDPNRRYAVKKRLLDVLNPKVEVHEHLVDRVQNDGNLLARCGKVWKPDPYAVSKGKCPRCVSESTPRWSV